MMTALVWDSISERTYETGIQKAVIHFQEAGAFPWNGLTKVDESEEDAKLLVTFFDGVKIHNQKNRGVYKCRVSGLSFPHEVSPILGMAELRPGFTITGQTRQPFDFTYQTLVGESDYKIHFVWNAVLVPSEFGDDTLEDTTTPTKFKWDVSATPTRDNVGYHASAHMVVSSSEVSAELMSDLVDWIYGTDEEDPYFPTQPELIAFFNPPFEPELIARFQFNNPSLDPEVSDEISARFLPYEFPVADPHGWQETIYDTVLTCPAAFGGTYAVIVAIQGSNDRLGAVTSKLVVDGVDEYVGPAIPDITYSSPFGYSVYLEIENVNISEGQTVELLIDRTIGTAGATVNLVGYVHFTRTGL